MRTPATTNRTVLRHLVDLPQFVWDHALQFDDARPIRTAGRRIVWIVPLHRADLAATLCALANL